MTPQSIYVTIAVEFVSLGLIGFFMHGYLRKQRVHREPSTAEAVVEVAMEDEKGQKTSPIFIASYLSIMLWGVISTVILSLFPTYIENLPGFVTEDFGYLLMVWNGIRTVAFIICARLPEHLMDEIIVIGALLSAISSAIIFLVIDFWAFMIAMAISGIAVGFNYLGALYLVVSATKLEKGAHAGLVESMGGVGLFLGPILGGWLMDFSLGLPYLMCTVLSLAVLIFMILLLRRNNAK
jgi:MFS family permease